MRPRRLSRFAVVVLALVVIPFAPPAVASTVPRFVPAECPIEFPSDVTVDCGYLIVRENRARGTTATIRLAVAILRTDSPTPRPDPILFLQGGPSFPAIDPFGFSLDYFGGAPYAADRDVILLDQRGVGSSRPLLNCPEFDRLDAATFPEGPTPEQGRAADRHCRDRLAAKADLHAYNLKESAADVRDLRVALGIPSWNILALSAGTYVAQLALRYQPQGIRSVILDSPLSLFAEDRAVYWRGNDRVLWQVFRGCAQDPVCERAHPDLRKRFWRFVHRLRAHPQTVTAKVQGGGTFTFRVGGNRFLEDTVFCAGFPAGCTSTVPATIDRAIHRGLQQQYGGTLEPPQPVAGFLAQAKSIIYQCHDQIAFITEDDVAEGVRELPEYRSFIRHPWWGDVCKIWHPGKANPAQYSYVHSDIPTLVLEGTYDGPSASSLPEARKIAKRLSRSFTFVFPGLGHIELFAGCARRIAGNFMNHPSVRPAGTCIPHMPQVDFSPDTPSTAWRPDSERPIPELLIGRVPGRG